MILRYVRLSANSVALLIGTPSGPSQGVCPAAAEMIFSLPKEDRSEMPCLTLNWIKYPPSADLSDWIKRRKLAVSSGEYGFPDPLEIGNSYSSRDEDLFQSSGIMISTQSRLIPKVNQKKLIGRQWGAMNWILTIYTVLLNRCYHTLNKRRTIDCWRTSLTEPLATFPSACKKVSA